MEEGKEILQKLTIAADDYYICLIDLNSQDAREFVSKNGTDTTEACEMFLRAFEEKYGSQLELIFRFIDRALAIGVLA